MKKHITRNLVLSLICAITLFVFSTEPYAANFPLEIINIKPIGTDGISANNRIFKAYPNIEYNIRAAIVGGLYPYNYSLSNAPLGMTINENTGEISWPNPQANANPTIIVVDSEGTEVTSSWTITVTTNGFRFIDAVNGTHAEGYGCSSNCGTGTFDNPWRSISDMFRGDVHDSTYAGEYLYFRTGTYSVTDCPRSNPGDWLRVTFWEHYKPVVWLEYPGENAVIDFGFDRNNPNAEWGPLIRFGGNTIYIDGFETINSHNIAFQVDFPSHYATFRRLNMHDHGPGIANGNPAFIMIVSGKPHYINYLVVQDNSFYNSQLVCAVKLYATYKTLIEDNIIHDLTDNDMEGIAIKDFNNRFTVRGNTIYNIVHKGIGGNMHSIETRDGEILFNHLSGGSINVMHINQDYQAGEIFIYRNTIEGRIRIDGVRSSTGPFNFYNNVIINNDAPDYLQEVDLSDSSRIIWNNNINGSSSDNIVNANGDLTPAYSSYLGTHGYQIPGFQILKRPSPSPRVWGSQN